MPKRRHGTLESLRVFNDSTASLLIVLYIEKRVILDDLEMVHSIV